MVRPPNLRDRSPSLVLAGKPAAAPRPIAEPTPIGRRTVGLSSRLLRALVEVSAQLRASSDLDKTLDSIVRRTAGLLGATYCGVLMLEGEGARLAPIAAHGVARPPHKRTGLRLDEVPILGQALEEQRPIYAEAPLADAGAARAADLPGRARWTVALPISRNSQPLGVLLATGTRRPRGFGDEEVEFAAAMANLAAIAISDAHSESRQRRAVWDLHDVVAQMLSCIRLKAKLAADALSEQDQATAVAEVAALFALSLEADRAARACIADLRAEPSVRRDPLPTLAETVEGFQRRTGQGVELLVDGAQTSLSPMLEAEVVRILQEALHNVEKHAAATRTIVRFTCGTDKVDLRVQDNGRGFDPARPPADGQAHLGLQTMLQRAHHAGGTLVVRSRPGVGTVVHAVLPVE